ncbi:hypothetical protein BGZ76_003172 [Entomortierella beljakovae]|nr:hypothetical protein BGZ76_003172 [Entomortierella beljakovae]
MTTHSLKSFFKGHSPPGQDTHDSKPNTTSTTTTNGNHHHQASNNSHKSEANHMLHNGSKPQIHSPDTHNTQEAIGDSQNKASDHKLTPGSRKRSILLNMMLPPEAPPVDAKLSIPPVILFPPVLEPEGGLMTVVDREIKPTVSEITTTTSTTSTTSTTTTTESNSTSRSFRSWIRGSNNESGGETQLTKRNKGKGVQDKSTHSLKEKNGAVKDLSVPTNSETTSYTSKSTHVKTWMSRFSHTENHDKQIPKASIEEIIDDKETVISETSREIGSFPGKDKQLVSMNEEQLNKQSNSNPDGSVTTVQQQEFIHQEIHQKTRNVSLVNVNISIQDIFGLGKVLEVILALSHAHGGFLRRQPFWVRCVVMGWEMLVILLLVWGVLRVVGLAEVIVWGADDLVRGTLSTIQSVGRTVYTYLSQ